MANDPRTKVSSSAIVNVTLEIDVGSTWGEDCTIAQVHKQAADEAEGTIRHIIQEAKKQTPHCTRGVTLVGIPKVTAVLNNREIGS